MCKIIGLKQIIKKQTNEFYIPGIDHKMAYAKRKYHSGWIWTGVTRGFASCRVHLNDTVIESFHFNNCSLYVTNIS